MSDIYIEGNSGGEGMTLRILKSWSVFNEFLNPEERKRINRIQERWKQETKPSLKNLKGWNWNLDTSKYSL